MATDTLGPVAGSLDVLLRPTAYFGSMPKEGGYLRPMARIALWSFVAAVIALAWEWFGLGQYGEFGGVPAAARGLFMQPLMGVAASFVGAAFVHVVCWALGGRQRYQATYRMVAAMAVMAAISALLIPVGFGFIVVQSWTLYLTVVAATQVHGTRKLPSWLVFGLMTCLALAAGWHVHQLAEKRAARESPPTVPIPQEGSLTPGQRQDLEHSPDPQ